MSRIVPSALAAAVMLLVGCGSDAEPSDTTAAPSVTEPGTVGIANPASVFCVEQGGTVEIETAADGSEAGICVLPDGTRIDEWEYFRSEAGASDTTDD